MAQRRIALRQRSFHDTGRQGHFARELAEFVRDQRARNRLGQGELAELAGVGRRFVSDLEGGKPTLQLAAVEAVLHVFGKTLGIKDAPRDEDEGEDAREA